MAKLEDITVGSHLTGIAGNEPVRVVAVQWYGTNMVIFNNTTKVVTYIEICRGDQRWVK